MKFKKIIASIALTASILSIGACNNAAQQNAALNDVSGKDWPIWGRNQAENHYSPLTQINKDNLSKLGLAWHYDLPVSGSALASPVAADGVLYVATGYSVIRAFDAASGRLLWTYDPDVASIAAETTMRLAWGVRGISYWDGKVYLGTIDGRLIALDSKSGKPVWTSQTTTQGDGLYITGAPRIFNGMVIIGNGGADHSAVRGYVTAYDAKTGAKKWRFYTVPNDPAKGPDHEASDDILAKAVSTWTGEKWKEGGGGTVWNAITYDPELNRIYIGTGNGSPWNQKIRSPDGGDNWLLCSIVALDANTGKYIWHYQVNPGETWDYNAAMDIELTTLKINGQDKKVIMHAPKNGFFYVIDRENGKLLSAEPFAHQNWAERIDIATGRPVERPEARYPVNGTALVFPSAMGAHSWMPMSYSPNTGLVYVPTADMPLPYDSRGIDPQTWRHTIANGHKGVALGAGIVFPEGDEPPPPPNLGSLIAWNPVTQTKVWSVAQESPFNGGITTTASNLVIQGQADGNFIIRDARTGQELWKFFAQNGILGQPITYMAGGKQMISVVVGYGTAPSNVAGIAVKYGWTYRAQQRRVLTFALDGHDQLPPYQRTHLDPVVDDPKKIVDQRLAQAGVSLYLGRCMYCHGGSAVAGGGAPDLRKSMIPLDSEAFNQIVRDGALASMGMPKFSELTDEELESIRHYIRMRARQSKAK